MQNINLNLKAGEPQPVRVSGRVLMVLSADQGNALTIDFGAGGAVGWTLTDMGPGARIAPAGGFSSITVSSALDGAVKMVVTNGDIDVQILRPDAITIANGDDAAIPVRVPAGERLPVDIGGGNVELTATNVGINNTAANPVPVTGTVLIGNTPASPVPVTLAEGQGVNVVGSVTIERGTTVNELPPVAVPAWTAAAPNAVALTPAGAATLALRILNPISNTGTLFVGGAGVTPVNAVIALAPGDLWTETDAPGAAWYATSDAGTTANVQVIA